MAVSGVDTKCYILSLFVRDDGERFVLGNGYYEFKDNQLHFQTNTIANDIVEVQGNDGLLLAGQARRPGTQSFDGYIADGTVSKTETEEKRRAFFAFFRKNYFYKVVYVFPDGSAIQRKRGFLVDDPTVSELYQQYPEYHVALNFEDVNYYSYSENDDGEEIFAKEALVYLSEGATSGGLVWDGVGVEWDEVDGELSRLITESGKRISINNINTSATPIENPKIKGDTFQLAPTGKNLWYYENGTQSGSGLIWVRDGNTITVSGTATGTTSAGSPFITLDTPLPAGTYTASIAEATPYMVEFVLQDTNGTNHFPRIPANSRSLTITANYDIAKIRIGAGGWQAGDEVNFTIKNMQFEVGSTATDFEPYVGGMASPSPDYPQAIESVSGEQTITFENGQGVQNYNINLGKNLFDKSQSPFVNLRSTSEEISNGIRVTLTQASDFSLVVFKMFRAEDYIGQTITLSANMAPSSTNVPGAYIGLAAANGSSRVNKASLDTSGSCSYTIEKDDTRPYVILGFYSTKTGTYEVGDYVDYTNIQLELNSTATNYVPYITPIEIHKIGNYQDYIYKSGDDWYVHREIGKKTLDGSETWSQNRASYYTGVFKNELATFTPSSGKDNCRSNYFSFNGNNTTALENELYFHPNKNLERRILDRWPTMEDWKAWLSTHNTDVYFPLATPTDTQITDANLISQLNDLARLRLATGQNLIVTNSQELNAEVELSYRENALLSGGAIWEEGSGGGPTVVEVDSIDKVYPIWTVTGPAVNPQLSVLSTNTTLRYSGTVTESQTLVIDMFNKTALLNGTSVIGNVSGDWVNFAPGNNRVVYTTNNADANPSKIEWQEVVG